MLATPPALALPDSGTRLERRHASRGGLMAVVMDELDYGVMVVAADGAIRFANRAAWKECRLAVFLLLREGRIQARDARCQSALCSAIDAAAGGRRRMVSVHWSGVSMSVAVVPLKTEYVEAADAQIMLVLGRRELCEPLSVQFFAREIGLTLAETAVLQALCKGLSPMQVAEECRVAVSTVRTHVSSLRMKAGAKSIRDVLHMLTRLPPILPVLN